MLKANLRSRNIAVNSYLGILAITVVGVAATAFILHVAYDVPLQSVVAAAVPDF